MTKLRKIRHRQWRRYARRDAKRGYSVTRGYFNAEFKNVKRGDWRKRIQRKYAFILETEGQDD